MALVLGCPTTSAEAAPGQVDSTFAAFANGTVQAMAVQSDGKILIGGLFTQVGGENRFRFARLNADGTLDSSFDPGVDGTVRAIAVQPDGQIVIGGDFQVAGGQQRSHLARLSPLGLVDPDFDPSVDGNVHAILLLPDGRMLLGGEFSTVYGQSNPYVARITTAGLPEDDFIGETNGTVESIARQSTGKIIIAGAFTQVDSTAHAYVARLLPDGEIDPSFTTSADNTVQTVGVQSDDRILLGGAFGKVNNVTHSNLARLQGDGTLDSSVSLLLDGVVVTLALQANGRFLAGGSFRHVGASSRAGLARFNADGTLDTFNAALDNDVASLALRGDGRLLVGGDFTKAGSTDLARMALLENDAVTQSLTAVSASRIDWLRGGALPEASEVYFEVSTNGGASYSFLGYGTRIAGGWRGTGFGLPASGSIRAWARVPGGTGDASFGLASFAANFAGLSLPEIAVEQPVNTNLTSGTSTITFPDQRVGTAGASLTFTVRNTGAASLELFGITIDGDHADDFVATAPAASSVAAGSSTTFTVSFHPTEMNLRTAVLHLHSSDYDENPFDITLNGNALASSNADLESISLSSGTLAPAFDPATLSYSATVPFSVRSIMVSALPVEQHATLRVNGVQVTGGFQSAPISLNVGSNTISVVSVAQDGVTNKSYTLTITRSQPGAGDADPTFAPLLQQPVLATAVQPDGKIIIGGEFVGIGGQSRSYLARLNADGSVDNSFPPVLDGAVYAIALQTDGKIVIGGVFQNMNGVLRNYLARLNADGTLDSAFNPGTDDFVTSLAVQADGKIIVGGNFSVIAGEFHNYFARLNSNGTADNVVADADGEVTSVAVQADGKILVGGYFTQVAGSDRLGLARLLGTGALDTTFNPAFDGSVQSLAMQADGKIIVGGDFVQANLVDRFNLARLNADGTLDSNFIAGADDTVYTTVVQADGKILIGGNFSTAAGSDAYLTRLLPDGTVDPAFHPQAGNTVYSIAQQAGGGIIVGGNFETLSGESHAFLGRIANDPAVQTLAALSANKVRWSRDDSAPEITQVTFERSTDGATYTLLGSGTRVAGGWELSGVTLPNSGFLRARGRTTGGGAGASTGVVEFTSSFGIPVYPDIAVTSPTGAALVDGGTGVTLSSDLNVATATQTFTIRNTGGGSLSINSVTLDGSAAGDYLHSLTPTTVAPGASTTFGLTFKPSAVGSRLAALHIVSNDPDESPFDIALNGTGAFSTNANLSSLALSMGQLAQPFNPTTTAYTATVPYSVNSVTIASGTQRDSATVLVNGSAVNASGVSQPIALALGANVINVVVTAQSGATKSYKLTITRQSPSPGRPDDTFTPDPFGEVFAALPQPNGAVLLGGDFSRVAGQTWNNFARILADGTPDSSLRPEPDGPVLAIATLPDGRILLGGSFGMVGGLPRHNLALLNPDGSVDGTFHPDPDDYVSSLLVQADGHVLVGGAFFNVGGEQRVHLAQMDLTGAVTSGFNYVTNEVYGMAEQADGAVVVALDSDDLNRHGLARFSAAGVLDSSFNPALARSNYAVAIQTDGKILAGGNGLVRYLANGTVDTSFTALSNVLVLSLALQADGKILLGGTFSKVGATTRTNVARLLITGAVDTTLAATPDGRIDSLALQANGLILMGGDFQQISGAGYLNPYSDFARLENTAATETLTVSGPSRILWLRGGSAPEVTQVNFYFTPAGGGTPLPLGAGHRVSGGWELTGLNLPPSGTVLAQARASGGYYSSSSALLESSTDYSYARLRVEVPVGTVVADGATVDFGSLVLGGSIVQTVKLTNTGDITLNLGAPTKDGTAKGDYFYSGFGTDTLAPGASTTFTLSFVPTVAGIRAAALRLPSNGGDDAALDLNLTGVGRAKVPPVVTTGVANQGGPKTATLSASVDAQGTARAVSFEYGTTTAYGTTADATPATVSGAGATPVSVTLNGLQPHTLYHYRVRASGDYGSAVGLDKTFTTGNSAPVASNDTLQVVPPGGPLDVLANDTDADGDVLTVATKSALNPATAGTLTLSGGRLSFTASASFSSATFTYTAKDAFGGISAPATVTISSGTLSADSSKTIGPEGGTYSLAVTSTASFNVSETLTWVTVSPLSGAGSMNLTVVVQPNAAVGQRSGVIKVGNQSHTLTQLGQSAKPVIGPLSGTYSAIVSGAFSLAVPTQNGPVTYTATGLPSGLTLSNATGIISGTPKTKGLSHVKITAKNAFATADQVLQFDINVLALGSHVVGTYHGLIGRDPVLNGNLGSRVQITTGISGSFTCAIITGVTQTSFSGQLSATPSDPTHAGLTAFIPALHQTISLVLDEATDALTGTLTDGTHTAAVEAWRNPWDTVTKPSDLKGYYTFFLDQTNPDPTLPQGFGYGSFTVNATTGTLTLIGKLADGTVLPTFSTFVGKAGQVLVYYSLYGYRGSFLGKLTIDPKTVAASGAGEVPDDNALTGVTSWLKPGPLTATTVDPVYRAGFGPLPLTAGGGIYVPPAKGQRVLGLPAAAGNAQLDFTLGGLEIEGKEFSQLATIANPSATGLTNTITFATPNPNKVTMPLLTAATGAFAGDFTLPGATAALARKAPYFGQLVTTPAGTFGYGYFLLPRLPASNETVATSPRLSGSVVLDKAAP